jgi:hypothetical protein
MAKIATVTNFDTNLLRVYEEQGGQVIQDAVLFGIDSLKNDFKVVMTRDKAPLLKVDVKDGLKASSNTFAPQSVLGVKSRIADFMDADIDFEITNEDIKELYRSYLGWVMEPTRSESEVRDNPFELFFVRQVIARHFEFIRLKTAWKGVFNASAVGAENIADGLIAKITAGIADSSIAAGNVFTAAATISTSNAYDQVNGVADKVAAADEKLLSAPLNVYLSQGMYDKYRKHRRALFPEHVGPNERPTTHDDYSNMSFVVDPGLAARDKVVITKKENLLFVVNEDPAAFSMNIVRQVKSYQVSMRISAGFDFATGDWLFTNDKV